MVLQYAFALGVHAAEIVLGAGMTLLGGAAVPLHRLGMVLRYALALGVHEAEIELGAGIALLSQRAPFL